LFYTNSTGTYNEIDLATNSISWTGNLKTLFKPDTKTELQILLNYTSPNVLPQFKINEIYFVDVGVKRSFLDNKIAVSFTVSDIFNTKKWIIQSENSIYKLENNSKNETRIFWIGLTYTINSYKPTKTQKTEGTDNDGGIIKLGQ